MLSGKAAIVTGGARGIGAGIARVLASQGARVAILDLDAVEAEKTAASLPSPGMALACDAADEATVDSAVRSVVERFGGLDILVGKTRASKTTIARRDHWRAGRGGATSSPDSLPPSRAIAVLVLAG